MKSSVKVKKGEWKAIKTKLAKLDKLEVQTGFFRNARYVGGDHHGLPVAQVAAWQEFGINNIPSRPFFSHYMMFQARADIISMMRQMFIAILSKSAFSNTINDLEDIGEKLEKGLMKTIYEWDSPPNVDWWAEEKGFNDPLIHTEQMVNSVEHRVKRRKLSE